MMQRPNPENPPPLKVRYPFGGRHFILNWWTYGERGHLLMAKSEGQLRNMFERVAQIVDDTKVLAIQEVDIVGPSQSMNYVAAMKEYGYEVKHFCLRMRSELESLIEHKIALPKPFERCPHRKPDQKYQCDTCEGTGIQLVGISEEEIYITYADRWEQTFPTSVWVDKNLCLSQAAPADDSEVENLHVAAADYGHHNAAIYLTTMKEDPRTILFYYRPIQTLDMEWYNKRLAVVKNEMERQKEIAKIANRQRLAREKREKIDRLRAFFEV